MKNSIIFCEYIDSNNTPLSPGKTFELGPTGVNVKFFLPELNHLFDNGCKKFICEIFRVTDTSEKYEDTIFIEVKPFKNKQAEFTFYKSGKFHIRIYDAKKKNLINSGIVLIKNSTN